MMYASGKKVQADTLGILHIIQSVVLQSQKDLKCRRIL